MPPSEKFHEKIFRRNSYPEISVDICNKNFLNKHHAPKIVEKGAFKRELTLVLWYLGQLPIETLNNICFSV